MEAVAASNTSPRTAGEGKNLISLIFFPSSRSPPASHGGHSKEQGQPPLPANGAGTGVGAAWQGKDEGPRAEPGCQPCPEGKDIAPRWPCPSALSQMLAGKGKKQIPRCRRAWQRDGNVLARCGARGWARGSPRGWQKLPEAGLAGDVPLDNTGSFKQKL